MSGSITGLAYLIAAVCFIMALRGLSSPTMITGTLVARDGKVVHPALTGKGD